MELGGSQRPLRCLQGALCGLESGEAHVLQPKKSWMKHVARAAGGRLQDASVVYADARLALP